MTRTAHEEERHRVFIISDLHLGGISDPNDPSKRGFRMFTKSDTLVNFIEDLRRLDHSELVINGDFVDFLADPGTDAAWHSFIFDERRAVEALQRIIDLERNIFEALRDFVKAGHRLTILTGNHDIELSLPKVRRSLQRFLTADSSQTFEFLNDGEAFTIGDALIEHGNRYDPFNIVDMDGLRQYRSLLSRRQEVPDKGFAPPIGSQLVAEVINPLKSEYDFIDLLKPESEAVVPLLLALEPGVRSFIPSLLYKGARSITHGVDSKFRPLRQREIANVRDDALLERNVPQGTAYEEGLIQVLTNALGDEAQAKEFIASLPQPEPQLRQRPISNLGSTKKRFSTALSFAKLLYGKKSGDIKERLPGLLKALRCLQTPDTFNSSHEPEGSYRESVSYYATRGWRYVIYGHTHLAREVNIGGATYLNSGTWTDLLKLPDDLFKLPQAGALSLLERLIGELSAGSFESLLNFKPTFVELTLSADRQIVKSALRTYRGNLNAEFETAD